MHNCTHRYQVTGGADGPLARHTAFLPTTVDLHRPAAAPSERACFPVVLGCGLTCPSFQSQGLSSQGIMGRATEHHSAQSTD